VGAAIIIKLQGRRWSGTKRTIREKKKESIMEIRPREKRVESALSLLHCYCKGEALRNLTNLKPGTWQKKDRRTGRGGERGADLERGGDV